MKEIQRKLQLKWWLPTLWEKKNCHSVFASATESKAGQYAAKVSPAVMERIKTPRQPALKKVITIWSWQVAVQSHFMVKGHSNWSKRAPQEVWIVDTELEGILEMDFVQIVEAHQRPGLWVAFQQTSSFTLSGCFGARDWDHPLSVKHHACEAWTIASHTRTSSDTDGSTHNHCSIWYWQASTPLPSHASDYESMTNWFPTWRIRSHRSVLTLLLETHPVPRRPVLGKMEVGICADTTKKKHMKWCKTKPRHSWHSSWKRWSCMCTAMTGLWGGLPKS